MSDSADLHDAYPPELQQGEHDLLKKRRAGVRLAWNPDRLVGVGLSGGGIRSATFALGLFQGMARHTDTRKGLLRYIDFLSTVSGGGYFGSFFGRLLTRDYAKSAEDVEKILLGEKKPEVLRFLRENGRYLAPNGAGDALLFGSAVLRNWVSMHVVLGLFVLSLFLGLQSVRSGLRLLDISFDFSIPSDGLIWWSPWLWLPLLILAFIALLIGWAYWLVEPERKAIAEGAGKANATQETSSITPVATLVLVFVAAICLAIVQWGETLAVFWGVVATVAALTFGFWKLAKWRIPNQRSMGEKQDREQKMALAIYRNEGVRNLLAVWVTRALVVVALLLGVAVVDSLGQSVYTVIKGQGALGTWLAGLFGGLGVLAGFSRWIAQFFSKGPLGSRPSLPISLVAGVAALLIVLIVLVTLDAGSHAVAFGMKTPNDAPSRLLDGKEDVRSVDDKVGEEADRDANRALVGFVITLLLAILMGQTWPFVNRSSQLPLYNARLTRAYLGASNEARWYGQQLTRPVEGDDASLAAYWPPPEHNGAPLHLINVTVNETIDGRSQIQQQDRKGLGLALGPWGLSAGVRHHLVIPLGDEKKTLHLEGKPACTILPKTGFRVFDYPVEGGRPIFRGEALPLGMWLAISGAAFSTGTGMRTSLGLSLLAGLGNVRLGRWWDSGVTPEQREKGGKAADPDARPTPRAFNLHIEEIVAGLFPVQTYLLDEFLARFPGTSRRHWYLSDGGHFENMGGYELLRRRLRFILIADGEMDTNSTFEGLANLVRKARIDFGAEVHFLSEEQLDEVIHEEVRPYVGSLEQLRRGTWIVPEKNGKKEMRKGPHGRLEKPDRSGHSLAHAALARVTYVSDPKAVSWLLYVKPTLTGREPVDVLKYHTDHPDFPHETTIDQFFDEAQWESYRRLGEYIGEALFGPVLRLLPEDGEAEGSLLRDWDWDWKPDINKDKTAGRLFSYS